MATTKEVEIALYKMGFLVSSKKVQDVHKVQRLTKCTLKRAIQYVEKEGEKTLVEVRSLVNNLNTTSRQINDKIENLGEVVEASKKVAGNLSEASMLFSSRFVRPAARYWPILFPLIRLGMRLLKKKKEVKNGR